MARDIVIGMAGSGGDGIVSAGDSLVSAAALEGFHAMMTKSFGPQIRGGESSCRIRLSDAPLLNPGGLLDIAVALNWDDFLKFGAELACGPRTVVVYESKTGVAPDALPLKGVVPAQVFSVPLGDLTKSAAGTDKAKNSLVLGLLSGWIGVGREGVPRGIRARFQKKGDDVVQLNLKAFDAGLAWAEAHPLTTSRRMSAPAGAASRKLLADGNDVAAAAAIFAGCEFFSGYPITPSSEVMHFLGREIWKYGGALLQCEDEIAGIGAALGASLGGKKAMTATSGPGMDLKTEIMGLATIAELPLVILNVQRGGPSTGLPTKAEQSDLFQACFSAHGDVLRPVLAPTSVADTFGVMVEAFNTAEKYQTPVIVLSDQEIAHRKETFEPIDTSRIVIEHRLVPTPAELEAGYQRFAMTASRVSPVSHPGMPGGAYLGAGIEHDEAGAPASGGAVHARMNAKRFDKLAPLAERRDLVAIEGDPDAPLALVAWGSLGGVAREAAAMARDEGLSVKVLVPQLLYPVPVEIYARFFASVRAGLVVEQSHQGQLFRLLRMFVDVPKGVRSLARSGANPFQCADVVRALAALDAAGAATPSAEQRSDAR